MKNTSELNLHDTQGSGSAANLAGESPPMADDNKILRGRRAATGDEKTLDESQSKRDVEQRPHLRVLSVEDNPINQKLLLKMLAILGYRADTVANGLEALHAVRQLPYDVILMDCQMPVMDGYEATRQIRMLEQQEQRKPARIIAVTAHALPGDRELCLGAGMDEYLTKPVCVCELEQALDCCQPAPLSEDGVVTATVSQELVVENLVNGARSMSTTTAATEQEVMSDMLR
jgi:CheY-like chemotaxis protein